MRNYFENIETLEELKKAYKKLALKLHPDMNRETDTTEEFKKMQNEYEEVFKRVKNKASFDGKTYEKETTETPEEFKEIIDHLIFCDGLVIEIVGSWIWVTGNTYIHKDLIKSLKFHYSKNKQAWYYNGEETRTRARGHFTLDQLKERFETSTIKTKKQAALSC